MELRSTFVAVVIAIVAVAGAMTLESVAPASASSGARGPRPLFREGLLPAARVDAITIDRDDLTYEFTRTDGVWQQVRPFDYPMDGYSVEQIARLAEQLQTVQSLDAAAAADFAPSTLGLDPPDGRVRLDWPGGTLELRLGRRGVGGRAYLQVAGLDTIYVVNHDLHDRALDMDPREWRSRRLFQEAGVDSTRIEYSTGNGDERRVVTLVRGAGGWRMSVPAPSRVDETALDGLVGALGRVSSSGFVLDNPDGLGRFGLEPPAGSFTVVTSRSGGEDTQTLLVGGRIGAGTEDRFAMIVGRPVVVRLPAASIAALFPDPLRLLSPLACGVAPSDIKAIRVVDSSGEFVVERQLDQWFQPMGADEEPLLLDGERVQALLDALTAVRATQLEVARFPRDEEHVTLTLIGYDRKPLDSVRVLRPRDDTGWIMENGDGVLRAYPASMPVPLTVEEMMVGLAG